MFKRHYTVCAPCGPARTSLHTGLYLMNHRSGRNGTPLDDRFTNVAREARKAGFDPTLFGYTDTSIDPRTRHADDPALKTYEGFLPGFTVGMPLPEHMAAWIADLKKRGYDLPKGRDDVYKPRPGFQKPANRGHSFMPPVFTAEESETTFMADAILQLLSVRRRRELVRAWRVPAPASAGDRARALQRDVRSGRSAAARSASRHRSRRASSTRS